MISWIVASHDRAVLHENLLPTLDLGDDQLIVVMDAPSIAKAYNEGQAQAIHDIRCYVHHDVQILDLPALREGLRQHCAPGVGLVGVIGSSTPHLPWWEGPKLGSVVDGRMGPLHYGPGGPAAYLDGLLLATAQNLEWDETYPGWHLYDHDMSRQLLERGLTNWCLNQGASLVRHNTAGTHKMRELSGWDAGLARFTEKWGRS